MTVYVITRKGIRELAKRECCCWLCFKLSDTLARNKRTVLLSDSPSYKPDIVKMVKYKWLCKATKVDITLDALRGATG